VSAEQELRALVDERVQAVRSRNIATLAARPVDDVITFDVLPPLNSRGSHATVDHLQQWFDGYAGPIDYTVRDVQVSANDELGFCSFLYHVGGTLKTGDSVNMWDALLAVGRADANKLQVRQTALPDRAMARRRLVEVGVVVNDRDAVAGQAHVELDSIGAQCERCTEGGESVLRSNSACSAMGDDLQRHR